MKALLQESKVTKIYSYGSETPLPLLGPLSATVKSSYASTSAQGAFVWDHSGIRIIGIMQVSVCLGAILIPEYLDSILAILLTGAE